MSSNLINDPWSLIEKSFDIKTNYLHETLFSTGNGYFGMRGNFEEGLENFEEKSLEGNYINGFYESETIKYGEAAYGYAEKSQTMLNVTNSKIIKLYVEDEEFNMRSGRVSEYKRILDMKEGVLTRQLVWESPKGHKLMLKIERLISLHYRYLAAINYEIVPLNFDGNIKIISSIDGDVSNLTMDKDPRVGAGLKGRVLSVEEKFCEGEFAYIIQKTRNSGLSLICGMKNTLQTNSEFSREDSQEALKVNIIYNILGKANEKIQLTKFITYMTSKEFYEVELSKEAEVFLEEINLKGYMYVKNKQKDFLMDFWSRADIEIKGDIRLQQGIRFNMFQLLQSVGRDGRTSIAAKGLTGEGYEGHYFWDTEVYILPFFLYNNPKISRKLLEYRYSILDKARERARQMSHEKGALYAWRTINGEECSAYYPAGTAQYHINADIAFAIKRYMEATEDLEFLYSYGAEILFETARLWASLGSYIDKKVNKFCINGVTGPDEYSALVNNNCFTNLMARENLWYAYETAKFLKDGNKACYEKLKDKIKLEEEELKYWKSAADNMYIPYDDDMKIYLQDDSFISRAPWDFENTPKENYPLLLHYHPLVIYRHQVCKQADLILAEFLLGDRFSFEQKRRDYNYYEKLTTHDSSLSYCIFGIMACELGYFDKAYTYFKETAIMDLDNTHNNTEVGIHAANMAGACLGVINGFAGMRIVDGVLNFNPYLPKEWKEYRFKITFKGRLIEVVINKQGADYKLLQGKDITILSSGLEKILLVDKKDL